MRGRDDGDQVTHIIEVTVDEPRPSGDDDTIAPASPGSLWWRERRIQYVAVGAAFVVAVVVAFLVGRHVGLQDTGAGDSAPASGSSVTDSSAQSGPLIAQADGLCAIQVGAQLQLGIEIVNRSDSPVTLGPLEAILPLGGLRATKSVVGTCGQLQLTQAVPGTAMAAGDEAWLTVTFDVLVRCPSPLPVQFSVVAIQAGASSIITLGGFVDLGGLAYSGCDATS